MRQSMTWLMIGLLVLGVMALAWTQGAPEPAAKSQCTDCDDDCSGGTQEMRHGQMLVPPGAYINVNEASEAIWQKIGELQSQIHESTWELSVLYTEEDRIVEIREKEAEMRELVDDLRSQRRLLGEHLVFPEGKFQGMREGGRGGGGGGVGIH